MKKLYFLALLALGLNTNAQTTYFSQDFNNPSTATLADFTGSGANVFDTFVTGSGTPTPSTVSIANGKMVFSRTAQPGLFAVRTTDLTPTGGVYQLRFKVSANKIDASTSFLNIAIGSAYDATNGLPTGPTTLIAFRITIPANAADSTWNIVAANYSTATSTTITTAIPGPYVGEKNVICVINNTSSDFTYTAPGTSATAATLGSQKIDVYIENVNVLDDAAITNPTIVPTDIKIGSSGGTNARGTYTLDNFIFSSAVGTLPVHLTSFSGKRIANGNQLNWATASETNNDRFDILQSTDKDNFQLISSVSGKGKAAQYSYVDATPASGVNYYKLNQVDFDGTVTPSDVIAIKSDLSSSESTLSVSEGILKYSINSNSASTTSLQIFNMNGSQVSSTNLNLQAGLNQGNLSVVSLNNGVYVARFTIDGKVVSKKFIK